MKNIFYCTNLCDIFRIGTFGGLVEYGAEKKVSKHSNVSASVVVGMPTGVKLKIR